MKTITYYASNDTMGETSEVDCDEFRRWAKKELETRFPDYEIVVTDEQSLHQVNVSDDIEYEDHNYIQMVCGNLWDRCPWDWM